MAILDLLKKEQKNSNILTFKKHPYVELDLESKIHYLNGLALVMNEDDNIHESEKEYLSILINTFNLAPEQFEDILEFAINPQQDMILEMFEHFNTDEMKYLFLLDCMMIAHSDGDFSKPETDLIKQYILMLNLNEDLFNEIKNISISIINKDGDLLKKLIDTSKNIKIDLILHFIFFYNINMPDINKLNLYNDFNITKKFKKFALGYDFGIIIDNNGVVKSFGTNSSSMGIDNIENISNTFYPVINLPKDIKCISISVGECHSLALFENGDIYGWGANFYGQITDEEINYVLPLKMTDLPIGINPIKIFASWGISAVLLENGDLYTRGYTYSKKFTKYESNFKIIDFSILFNTSFDNGLVLLDENNKIFLKQLTSSLEWLEWYDEDEEYIKYHELKGLPDYLEIINIISSSESIYVQLEDESVYGIGSNIDGQLGIGINSKYTVKFAKIYDKNKNIIQISTNNSSDHNSSFLIALADSKIYGNGALNSYKLGKPSKTSKSVPYHPLLSMYYDVEEIPKTIDELSIFIQNIHKIEVDCNLVSICVCDFSISKLYEMKYDSEITSYDFSK